MLKFVKICTSRSPHTPNCPHPTIGNVSLPHTPLPTATMPQTRIPHISPQSPTFRDLKFSPKIKLFGLKYPQIKQFQ